VTVTFLTQGGRAGSRSFGDKRTAATLSQAEVRRDIAALKEVIVMMRMLALAGALALPLIAAGTADAGGDRHRHHGRGDRDVIYVVPPGHAKPHWRHQARDCFRDRWGRVFCEQPRYAQGPRHRDRVVVREPSRPYIVFGF